MLDPTVLVAAEPTGTVGRLDAPPLAQVLPFPVLARAWPGKRAVDIVLSLVLIVLSLPLFLLLATIVKLTSRGPVLFRQRRVGRGGKDFPMLKFRTMHTDAEDRLRSDAALYELFVRSDHKVPSAMDPRITASGRLLRRLSLDELPQLLNVLLGHMSLVGPRPVERSQLIRDYGEHQSTYLALRPGLTGLWQVSGRSTVQFPERAELDRQYLRACGPWVDAKIILRTPLVVFTGLGAD
ncbi:MAG TPA: sugar transferase [Acidimicrobiales bacterium]|nr:sugar transferase [Acidimicrobiales bacterium]